MRLELYITSDGLVYQCGDEPPCTMYGSAANCGVQFDDEYHTTVRAFGTKSPYLGSLRVVQDGIGGRDFCVPVGMPVVLNGTEEETGLAWQVVSIHWDSLYQHKLYFENASQVMEALSALSRLNITVLNVEVRPGRCRSLSFRTPYLLGPVMRGVLCNEMQPAGIMFNRHPRTWEKLPFWYGITLGQAALTLVIWLFLWGLWLLGLLHFGSVVFPPDKIIMCVLLTALFTWVGTDVHGLLKTAEVVRSHRAVDRLVNGKRYADAR
jgi:hypothetical protein